MKLLRRQKDRCIFHLSKPEGEILSLILRLYPVIPPAHQRLTKSSEPVNEANQRLLDEALAEQRNENKKLVEAFLADAKRFQVTDDSARIKVTAGEIEWLLQVLNDVRVGNWILLGSPDNESYRVAPDDPNAPRLFVMEVAGEFQHGLLHGLNKKLSGNNSKKPPADDPPTLNP